RVGDAAPPPPDPRGAGERVDHPRSLLARGRGRRRARRRAAHAFDRARRARGADEGGRAVIARALLAAFALAALCSCDESQVWHEPDFQLDRMQEQPRIDPFDPAMAAPPPFTVARGRGPGRPRPPIDRALVETGRAAFERTCAACHGVRGDGDSVVATKMLLRRPPSLLEGRLRALSDDQVHEIVDHGYGMMPPYAGLLSFEETWAVVSYVRALQLAQGVDVATLPPE